MKVLFLLKEARDFKKEEKPSEFIRSFLDLAEKLGDKTEKSKESLEISMPTKVEYMTNIPFQLNMETARRL